MPWVLETHGGVARWRPDPAPPGVVIAATTRIGGVSEPPYDRLNVGRSTDDSPAHVDENRHRVLESLALDPGRLATAGQVHGTDVARVVAPGLHPRTDGLVTTEPGMALAVSGADCLVLMLAAGDAVAAAHAGWRGIANGMPQAVLTAMLAAAGCAARDARVHLGPCIGPCCFRVGDDVAARFPAGVVDDRPGGPYVDLGAAARLQLEAAGVTAGSIIDPPACTSCATELLFSHRRDRGVTGRQWGVAARRVTGNGGRV